MKTVWIYVNSSKDVGDVDHIKVFASEQAAEKWLAENVPEGVAFKYPSSSWRGMICLALSFACGFQI
jgi:hypothetical protein